MLREDKANDLESLSLEDRSTTLKAASADYLRGEISEEKLEEIEEKLSTDYSEAALGVASVSTALISAFQRLFLKTKSKQGQL